jgi:hypothetical protein
MVVGEVVTGEGAVLTGGLIEHGHMWLDAMLVDEPSEHLG